jgi:ATP-dependent Clp protease adaptor protein ClpS
MLIQSETETQRQEDTDLVESLEPRAKVFVHNDEVTPYDFVIMILSRFFLLDSTEAEHVTWTAHSSGTALVAILPLTEAQKRVGRAHFATSLEGYPLTFSIEPE